MFFVVAYDIDNDKRRKKISDILEGYGFRVNFSVFEIELNPAQLDSLLKKIKSVSKKTDNIRFYHICKSCASKSFLLYKNKDIFSNSDWFVL